MLKTVLSQLLEAIKSWKKLPQLINIIKASQLLFHSRSIGRMVAQYHCCFCLKKVTFWRYARCSGRVPCQNSKITQNIWTTLWGKGLMKVSSFKIQAGLRPKQITNHCRTILCCIHTFAMLTPGRMVSNLCSQRRDISSLQCCNHQTQTRAPLRTCNGE